MNVEDCPTGCCGDEHDRRCPFGSGRRRAWTGTITKSGTREPQYLLLADEWNPRGPVALVNENMNAYAAAVARGAARAKGERP